MTALTIYMYRDASLNRYDYCSDHHDTEGTNAQYDMHLTIAENDFSDTNKGHPILSGGLVCSVVEMSLLSCSHIYIVCVVLCCCSCAPLSIFASTTLDGFVLYSLATHLAYSVMSLSIVPSGSYCSLRLSSIYQPPNV